MVQPPFAGLESFDNGLRKTLNPQFDFAAFGRELYEKVPLQTIIQTHDEFNCIYGVVRPRENTPVYLVGPIIRTLITEETGKRICSQYGQLRLEEFMKIYQSIFVSYDASSRDFWVNLYAETFPGEPFSQKAIPDYLPMPILKERDTEEPSSQPDLLSLQEHSRKEALLMEAIVAGDSQLAIQTLNHLEDFSISDTYEDSYLSLKDQLNELNAICRYAVCSSQKVSPLAVLRIHRMYAQQIRSVDSIRNSICLAHQMVSDYCACVQEETLTAYSPLIRRVISQIRQETANQLSLRYLAEVCNVNASYLSNQFRTETGITLTKYINRHRVEKSLPLLLHSQLSIAQVSESVGFLDENYYARIFKKIKGVSPKVYRKNSQNESRCVLFGTQRILFAVGDGKRMGIARCCDYP